MHQPKHEECCTDSEQTEKAAASGDRTRRWVIHKGFQGGWPQAHLYSAKCAVSISQSGLFRFKNLGFTHG